MTPIDWNAETIAQLRALWDTGLSASQIGARMGLTKNAVVGKARRLKLPARPSPLRERPPTAVRSVSYQQRKERAKAAAAGIVAPRPVVVKPPAPPIVLAPPPARPRSARQCSAIEGDSGAWVECTHPAVRGSYCLAHGARYYRPAPYSEVRA